MLNFLANLGSGLRGLGSAFGRGAGAVGKGIAGGFKRLGELGDEEMGVESPDMFRTPSFNPDAGRGVRLLEDAVATAENDARADSLLERRNLPIAMPSLPGGPPPLTTAPSLNELRTALPSLPSRPSPPLAAPPAAPKAVPDLVPDMDLDRRNAPIPRLPGHAGAPTPYNQIDAAKYDYTMKGAKRDAEGNFSGGFNRDWKMSLRNALLGASAAASSARPGEDPLGKALGGALAGGAGSLINPQAGYEFAFDAGERPKMEAEMAREQVARDRANLEILNRAKLEGMEAETGLKRSQADKARADIDLGLKEHERQRLKDESERRWRDAQTLAELTGVKRVEDIYNPQTGAFETVAFYPGGKTEVVGRSAKAQIDLLNIKQRDDESKRREAGETGREGMRQSGQNQRQQIDINAKKDAVESGEGELKKSSGGKGGGATLEQIQRIISEAKKKGQTVTEEQVRARLQARGQ
jgi:hypothetical protein